MPEINQQTNQDDGNDNEQKPWTLSVKTTTSLSDVDAIKKQSQSPSDFVIDIPLTKNQFRALFEDTNTTSSGADYDPEQMLARLAFFFEATTTNTNNEILSTDLYQLMVSNFTDLTVNVAQLNAACSSNLKMSNDELKNNVVYKYFSSANTTTEDKDGNGLKVYQAIAQKLNYMIERNDTDSSYHYTKFWDNSKNNNSIILEGSIHTPSSQKLNVPDYTHADKTTSTEGWFPCSLKFVQSDSSYGYK